jgi:DNA-binding transcriptional MerR regulator
VDPLSTLRTYQSLAPWNLRGLTAIAGAILDAAAVTPINAAARAVPSERTIRFYVTRGIVTPPEGRGTAAVYTYRHLLQVLAVKLRQMEGGTLTSIARELADTPGDVLERRIASVLGSALPPPDRLALGMDVQGGRVGRAVASWLREPAEGAPELVASEWRRIAVARGLELHVAADHPLARLGPGDSDVADVVREAVHRLLPDRSAGPAAGTNLKEGS